MVHGEPSIREALKYLFEQHDIHEALEYLHGSQNDDGEEELDEEEDGEEVDEEVAVDAFALAVGSESVPEEAPALHIQYKLAYDGTILLPPSAGSQQPCGVQQLRELVPPSGLDLCVWATILDKVEEKIRTYGLKRGRKRFQVIYFGAAIAVFMWIFFNFGLLTIWYLWLNSSHSWVSSISFIIYSLGEWLIFNLPGYFAHNMTNSYDKKLYAELQEGIWWVSENMCKQYSVRVVVRFAKGTGHPRTVFFVARQLRCVFCSKISALGTGYRYDLTVLPWEITDLRDISVHCPNCQAVVKVNSCHPHFRCMRCLYCSALDLPSLAPHEHPKQLATPILNAAETMCSWAPLRTFGSGLYPLLSQSLANNDIF